MAQHSFEEIFLKKIVNELPNASNVCHEKVFRKLQEQVNYKRLVNTKEQYLDAPTNSSIEIESGKSRLAFAKISLLVCRIYDEIDILVKEELQCKTYKEAVLEASEQKFSCGVSTPAPKSPIKQKKNNEKIIQEAFEDLSNCLRNLDCAQNLNTTRKSKEIFPDVSEGKRKRDFDDDSDLDASDLTSFEDEIILTSDEESGTKKKKILLKDVKEKPEQANDKKLKESDDIQLIFPGEYTKAMSKDWHSANFCCWQCDESLTGQSYILRDEHPYCVQCYKQVLANSCEECGKLIGIDSKDLSYKEKHWHEACFLRKKCIVSLVDKPFGSKAEKVYCANRYDASFATRCDGCGEVFKAGTKKMEYKRHQWHHQCFCCCMCKNTIGTKGFIPRDNDIYCTGCFGEKYATRCIKCNQIITSRGVTYRNEPWHRECFCCTNCNTCLAGQRFRSRDDKPYCADCFGELFARRCFACSRPITGIGGTQFISFEDRTWHNDCFICAMCKSSLVGKGFITDGPEILCPECAK